LREKKVRGFFLQLEYQKKIKKISKNIEKSPYRRVAQKKVHFCTRRRKSHFFLTHPVVVVFTDVVKIWLGCFRHFGSPGLTGNFTVSISNPT